jgi:hypothetical protein
MTGRSFTAARRRMPRRPLTVGRPLMRSQSFSADRSFETGRNLPRARRMPAPGRMTARILMTDQRRKTGRIPVKGRSRTVAQTCATAHGLPNGRIPTAAQKVLSTPGFPVGRSLTTVPSQMIARSLVTGRVHKTARILMGGRGHMTGPILMTARIPMTGAILMTDRRCPSGQEVPTGPRLPRQRRDVPYAGVPNNDSRSRILLPLRMPQSQKSSPAQIVTRKNLSGTRSFCRRQISNLPSQIACQMSSSLCHSLSRLFRCPSPFTLKTHPRERIATHSALRPGHCTASIVFVEIAASPATAARG